MSRLIDADVLIEAINKSTCNFAEHLWKRVVCDVIGNQPTAYDANKVALELRHLAFRLPKDYSGLDGKDRAVMFDDAIDIVRKGGIE